jgi:hypothetical protein
MMIKVHVEEVAGHRRAPVRKERACSADAGNADSTASVGEEWQSGQEAARPAKVVPLTKINHAESTNPHQCTLTPSNARELIEAHDVIEVGPRRATMTAPATSPPPSVSDASPPYRRRA